MASTRAVPQNFICCLTLDILKDPVSTPRGFVFERQAIVEWLSRGERSCPLTREPLEEWELTDNVLLLDEILRWKKLNGIADVRNDYQVSTLDMTDISTTAKKKVMASPHLSRVRERILKQREIQFRAHLNKV